MAATIEIHEMTGTSAGTDKTDGTVRFKAADDQTVDTNDRLQIPAEGTTYSYSKQLRLYMEDAPSVDIQNLRAYPSSDEGFGEGVAVEYDVSGSFGANINTDIDGEDLFEASAVYPIDLDENNAGPFDDGDLDSYIGDFLRLQMQVGSTATPGALTPQEVVFAYDET